MEAESTSVQAIEAAMDLNMDWAEMMRAIDLDLVGESVVATSLAIGKLVTLLTGEPELIEGLNVSDFGELKDNMEDLKLLLETAVSKIVHGNWSSSAWNWLPKVKELAQLIEKVIEDYIVEAIQRRQQQRGLVNFLSIAGRLNMGLSNDFNKLAFNIQKMKASLLEVKESEDRYYLVERESSISESSISESHSPRYDFVLPRNCSVRDELIQRLTGGGPTRSVISLVGMGGCGKTILAYQVFESKEVRRYFDFCYWVQVSRSFSIEELLYIMIRAELQSKRYIVVLDDIWKLDFWQVVKHVFPDNDKGSRIIVTTRNETIAASCTESSSDYVHKLKPLSDELSLALFCRTVFQSEHCPSELEQLSLEYVRKCEGLPLAIGAIARFLSSKENDRVSEWKKLLASFDTQFECSLDLRSLSSILAKSFHDLPGELRICFLYFSTFPKDFLIPNDRLFKLWIAEGFVQKKEGKTLEEVAEQYLNEFIYRNLVQECEEFYGLEKFCRLHSLMHEIARQEADKYSFCQIHDGKNSSSTGKCRRLSVCNKIEKKVLKTIKESQLRSLSLFNISALDTSFLVLLFEKYKLLTLLDFDSVLIDHVPKQLGNLIHLKYLSLKNTKVKRIPKSIGKLQNLQTLDLRNTLLTELPIEINKLQKLQHLLASGYDNNISLDSTQGVIIKEGFGCLENLQTLMTVESHLSGIGLIRELEKLRGLKKLGISRLTAELSSALCACIVKMSHLESLSLHLANNYEILDLQTISSPPAFLQRLVLKGRLQKLPDWFSSLQNLSMLCLSSSRLTDDPLECLHHLPNLVSLWLYRAYEGEKLHFQRGGFQNLKLLVLRELQGLNVLEIEEGALPLLEELRIGSSPLLNEMPSGIQYLRNLKVLSNYDMPSEFVLSVQPDGGFDHLKVRHVPSVLFWYRVQRRRYVLYNLGESDLLNRLQGLSTNTRNFVQQNPPRLSFCYSDDEDLASINNASRLSFSMDHLSFFSDDIED